MLTPAPNESCRHRHPANHADTSTQPITGAQVNPIDTGPQPIMLTLAYQDGTAISSVKGKACLAPPLLKGGMKCQRRELRKVGPS